MILSIELEQLVKGFDSSASFYGAIRIFTVHNNYKSKLTFYYIINTRKSASRLKLEERIKN